jgi:hypothetical protein
VDLFLLITSLASVVLFLSLRQLRRQLRQRREQIREQFDQLARGERGECGGSGADAYPGGRGGVPAGIAGIELTDAGAAAEQRRMCAPLPATRCHPLAHTAAWRCAPPSRLRC